MGMKDLLIGLALLSGPVEGRLVFAEECAGCHGRLAEGTTRGPALILLLYGPAGLGDDAFHRAVHEGAPARHWDFGDMPAFAALPERRLARMLIFVRADQWAQGVRRGGAFPPQRRLAQNLWMRWQASSSTASEVA